MRWFLVFLPLIFVLSFARAQDADGYMLDGEKKMKDQDFRLAR